MRRKDRRGRHAGFFQTARPAAFFFFLDVDIEHAQRPPRLAFIPSTFSRPARPPVNRGCAQGVAFGLGALPPLVVLVHFARLLLFLLVLFFLVSFVLLLLLLLVVVF